MHGRRGDRARATSPCPAAPPHPGTGGAAGTDQIHLFMVGGTYAIGPGIKLVGGFYYEAATGQNQSERTDSWQFLIGTELRF